MKVILNEIVLGNSLVVLASNGCESLDFGFVERAVFRPLAEYWRPELIPKETESGIRHKPVGIVVEELLEAFGFQGLRAVLQIDEVQIFALDFVYCLIINLFKVV